MNGVNNQSINPMITQNLGVFQEQTGSPNEFEDLFPLLQDGQEIMDFPLDSNEVEVTHFQETQDVNTAKSSKRKWTKEEDKRFFELKQRQPYLPWKDFAKYFPRYTHQQCSSHWKEVLEPRLLDGDGKHIDRMVKSRTWTKEEDKQFVELKQRQPYLPWKDFAKYFPGRTAKKCGTYWRQVLQPRLYRDGKLTDPEAEKIDPTAANELWTQEENARFIELKQQQPALAWKDFAQYFPGHALGQCRDHWNLNLKRKLIRKRELTGDGNNDNRLSKRLRTESSGLAIPAIPGENTHLFVNPSQEIPQELAILSVFSPSNALQQVQEIMDFPLHHYEGAVNHLQEIQLADPLFQSFQQEVVQFLASIKKTYQDMKERLTETDSFPIIQEAKSLANLCQVSLYSLETVYQHFISYQTSQESKEWFVSQIQEFATLYLAFLKGKMDETNFHHFTFLKERDHCYQNLNNLFIQHQNTLNKHSSCFSLEYNKSIDESFFNIRLQFNFLKYAQQDWKSMASGLKEVLSRLQEIEIFFESFFNHVPSTEVESIIIARIGNEISLQDFYAKQAALMTAQKGREQTGDSIPSQQSSQIQKDLPSSHVLPSALNQEY